jgi:hypothetical protein
VARVNPGPTFGGRPAPPKYSVDVSRVPTEVELDRVTIAALRTTLHRGFANAVGSRLSTPEAHDSMVLVFDSVEPEMSNLGTIGRFVTIRFRGRWMTPDDQVLAEFAGTAQPRNPTETGERHLEDVVEVMYEKIIGGLSDALRNERGNTPAAPKQPAAAAPATSRL